MCMNQTHFVQDRCLNVSKNKLILLNKTCKNTMLFNVVALGSSRFLQI